jgi:hypothetical protein
MKHVLASAERANESIRRSVAMAIPADAIANAARAVEQYQVVAPALERALEHIKTNQLVFDRVQELFRRYSPENWHDLRSGEIDVIDLVQDSGIPVVWVPRAEIIEALLAADGGDRYAVLVSSSPEVLEDLTEAIARARGAAVGGHAEACDFAEEAVGAAIDGHWSAAQALAASGLGQVLHGMFGYPLLRGLGAARKKFSQRDVDDATMMVLKAALLEKCTAKALTDIPDAHPDVSTGMARSMEIVGSSPSPAPSAACFCSLVGSGSSLGSTRTTSSVTTRRMGKRLGARLTGRRARDHGVAGLRMRG